MWTNCSDREDTDTVYGYDSRKTGVSLRIYTAGCAHRWKISGDSYRVGRITLAALSLTLVSSTAPEATCVLV